MRRQLRAIEGPLSGAVYVVHGRTRLGRAGDSDIQILHDGVSRQHAQVLEDASGNAVLVDLASNNGTFIGEKRVVRHRLHHGDEIRIMRARFIYEEVDDEEDDTAGTSAVFAVKVFGAETHRRTVDHWQLDLPAPRKSSEDGKRPPSTASIAEPGPERHRVVACHADGSTYQRDILADILEYRALRVRSLRGDALGDDEIRRYGLLQAGLHQRPDDPDPNGTARKFHRFRCGFPARLRHGAHFGDLTTRVTVIDLSAGGAGLQAGVPLVLGELAWLVVDLVVGTRPRTIVLTGRIVSSETDRYGLLFAGAPEWEQWRPP
ncbi:MAG TPA: FHA domain-containing protein [Nannocystaceae bacterium]|nr:FHA domain-containing protein [Nannocystaceae bacterium]